MTRAPIAVSTVRPEVPPRSPPPEGPLRARLLRLLRPGRPRPKKFRTTLLSVASFSPPNCSGRGRGPEHQHAGHPPGGRYRQPGRALVRIRPPFG